MFALVLLLCWIPLTFIIHVNAIDGHKLNDIGRKRGYNIALHAQVIPTEHKVVGSVITTNGLKAALLNRFDVSTVEIFYPGQYKNYLERNWDFLVIEGWFLGLVEFIQVTRNRYPDIVIVFYCLDPTFPSLPEILDFDIDGIMTNSLMVKKQCEQRGIPSIYLMLAADPDVMKPNPHIARKWKTVYVGAGGLMLQQKPALHQMLIDAKNIGLRLHGTGWNTVPILSDVWSGPLPQNELTDAYASAEIVLASTIQSQDAAGMVNNRIFEALACGCIVMTCDDANNSTLATLFGRDNKYAYDLVSFYTDKTSMNNLVNRIAKDPMYAQQRRQFARDFVVQRHTWAHRCIEMMNFLTYLKSIRSDLEVSRPRPNQRRLLWIESEELLTHIDYAMILRHHLRDAWKKSFEILVVAESEWLQFYQSHCLPTSGADALANCFEFLKQFEAIFTVITAFDTVDRSMIALSSVAIRANRGSIQRRFTYLMGISSQYFQQYCGDISNNLEALQLPPSCRFYNHYDTVFYRSNYEIDLLSRQFGIIIGEQTSSISSSTGINAAGASLPSSNPKAYRSQQLFAIPSITRNVTLSSTFQPNDKTLDEVLVSMVRKDVAFICFYHHRSACRRSQRLSFVKSYPQPHEALLILLGGKFEHWLDDKEDFDKVLDEKDSLANVIHVSDHLLRFDDLIFFLESIENVVIMNGGSLEDRASYSTTTDIIFPLVASTILNRRIHLSQMNSHLVGIVQEGYCTGWDNVAPFYHWDRSIKHGLDRVFGMPSRQSSVSIQPLLLSKASSANKDNNKILVIGKGLLKTSDEIQSVAVKCLNCNEVRDEALLGSGYLDHLMNRDTRTPFLFLHIDYRNFQIGPDGQLCVNRIGGTVDDMMCLLRTMSYMIVEPKDTSHMRRDANTGNVVFDLHFNIRGNLFADLIWNETISVSPSYKEWNHGARPSLLQQESKEFQGVIMDDIFTFNYPTL